MAVKPAHYNFFWRWHFYAGLIVTPIVLVMAVTGAIYLLQPQIEDWLYRDRMFLQEDYQGPVDHDAIIQAAASGSDAEKIQSYQPPVAPGQSAQVVLTARDGKKLTVFLHPGTHAILGTADEQWRLTNIARNLHKNLMLGTPGRAITELTACWLIVMIVTGFYLWWPRGDKERGTAVPNTKTEGRKLWREFHAVPGAWAGIWILALLITGLPWSMVWGGLLSDLSARAGEGFPEAIFAARPMSPSGKDLPETSMNRLFETIAHKNIAHAFKIEYPWQENGSYALMPLRHSGRAQDSAFLFFDRRSGEVLDEYRWSDLGKVGRLTTLGVAFHEGRLFGSANQMLNLTAVLVLISMCITGPVMWWKRKPQKALGAPRSPECRLPAGIIGAVIASGIVLPLFGASVVVIWLGEALTMRTRKRRAVSR